MPRYYFDLQSDVILHDEEGIELADPGAAYVYAGNKVREMLCTSILRRAEIDLTNCITIRDTDGIIAKIRLLDAVTLISDQPPIWMPPIRRRPLRKVQVTRCRKRAELTHGP